MKNLKETFSDFMYLFIALIIYLIATQFIIAIFYFIFKSLILCNMKDSVILLYVYFKNIFIFKIDF